MPVWRVKLFMSEVSFRSHLALPFWGRVAEGVCRCDVLSMCEVSFRSHLALPLRGRVAEGVCRCGVLSMCEVSFRSHLALALCGRVAEGELNCSCLRRSLGRCGVLSMCEVSFSSHLALPLFGTCCRRRVPRWWLCLTCRSCARSPGSCCPRSTASWSLAPSAPRTSARGWGPPASSSFTCFVDTVRALLPALWIRYMYFYLLCGYGTCLCPL